jgi:hypothetical protein
VAMTGTANKLLQRHAARLAPRTTIRLRAFPCAADKDTSREISFEKSAVAVQRSAEGHVVSFRFSIENQSCLIGLSLSAVACGGTDLWMSRLS